MNEMRRTIVLCFEEVFQQSPTEELVNRIINEIPEDIKLHAKRFGWGDTEVGDTVFEWLEDNFLF